LQVDCPIASWRSQRLSQLVRIVPFLELPALT